MGSAPSLSLIKPSSMLPLELPGIMLRNVSRLTIIFPSAPNEGPNCTRPATRKLTPATSESTVLPLRNQSATGPNSLRERSSNKTLPFCCKYDACRCTIGSIKSGSLGSNPRAKIDLVVLVSGFRQSTKFQCTGDTSFTSGSASV